MDLHSASAQNIWGASARLGVELEELRSDRELNRMRLFLCVFKRLKEIDISLSKMKYQVIQRCMDCVLSGEIPLGN